MYSWSKSGRLLASGSDDQHLNIHTYQPDDSASRFSLNTTVATGHTANIFSVKFMPHSNDRTLVTAAGDSEVRVFDIEYAGAVAAPSAAANMATHGRRRGRNNIYEGVRYLSDGDTNCRVYRSHGDRVKRIVTESSPHLFLTCSEDGEVRQWDLRQPSSAYPSPRGARFGGTDVGSVPPPLISYKRFMLDLNTISCSPSQPHYIALGGAHLHCFLHDRRMLGRDNLRERGLTPVASSSMSDTDELLMNQATQCVKKFAPSGQPRMRRTDNGHITACKISDANPNEMIVSWSGENIYSFDLLRSPDAREAQAETQSPVASPTSRRVKDSGDRKRKRNATSQTSLAREAADRAQSRQRTEESPDESPVPSEMALRVQYGNGQTEDIPINETLQPQRAASHLRESVLTDRQKRAFRLAKATVNIRKHLFTLGEQRTPTENDPTGHTTSFTSVLGYCASVLPEMKAISSEWRYPVDPSDADLILQRTLRSNRDSAFRFVQTSGVIARALGGHLRTGSADSSRLTLFHHVSFVPNEGPDLLRREQFCYDFIKAIVLWLESGVGALLEGFAKSAETSKTSSRLPVPNDAGAEAVEEALIPYLLRNASRTPVVNVDASRFEIDENRVVYSTEQDAVLAFAAAVKIPFADLSSSMAPARDGIASHEIPQQPAELTQDRPAALRHWGLKVARGVLMNAGEGVNFAFVDRAFGGLGQANTQTARTEEREEQRHQDITAEEDDPTVRAVEIVQSEASNDEDPNQPELASPPSPVSGALEYDDFIPASDLRATIEDEEEESLSQLADETTSDDDEEDEYEEDEDDDEEEDADIDPNDDENDDEDEDEDEDEDDGDEEDRYGLPSHMYRSAFDRRRLREKVEERVPCAPHSRVYRGHCNVKTVKDVNFFGLEDEYVVSGSDDGNLFIWDRKTAQLVNILEGDGEVVNVLQGHPYEPMLAVSGIDHTIKIFSPDARAREAARLGRGIEATDATEFSSIAWPARVRGRRMPRQDLNTTSEPTVPEGGVEGRANEDDDEEYVAPNGLSSKKRMHLEYQITSQNDVDRQGGNQEAFITVSTQHDGLAVSLYADNCKAQYACPTSPVHPKTSSWRR